MNGRKTDFYINFFNLNIFSICFSLFLYFKDSVTNMCIDNLFKNHDAYMGICAQNFNDGSHSQKSL